MKLSELIHEVWKDERVRKLGLRKNDEVKVVIEVILDHIVKGILQDGVVKMKGLFTLRLKEAKGRKIRNPQTDEEMYSKDYFKIILKPSKSLKDGLEELRNKK